MLFLPIITKNNAFYCTNILQRETCIVTKNDSLPSNLWWSRFTRVWNAVARCWWLRARTFLKCWNMDWTMETADASGRSDLPV